MNLPPYNKRNILDYIDEVRTMNPDLEEKIRQVISMLPPSDNKDASAYFLILARIIQNKELEQDILNSLKPGDSPWKAKLEERNEVMDRAINAAIVKVFGPEALPQQTTTRTWANADINDITPDTPRGR